MKTIYNTDYCPSATWNEFLHNLFWRQDTHIESAYKAFKEAIRRGISRSDVFFDVAEAIHRSYCPVNWGVLNWNWKLALQDSDHDNGSTTPAPTPKTTPPPPFQQPPPVNGKGVADHRRGQVNGEARQNGYGHHNGHGGVNYQQRRPASLISYYE